MQIWELEDDLSNYPDSKEVRFFVDGIEYEATVEDGPDGMEIHLS